MNDQQLSLEKLSAAYIQQQKEKLVKKDPLPQPDLSDWDVIEVPTEYMEARRYVLDEVQAELWRAIRKHTFKRTPMNPGMEDLQRLVVLLEEMGESAEHMALDPEQARQLLVVAGRLARAVTYDEGNDQKWYEELKQVAAMTIGSMIGLRLASQHISLEST